jgi:hypothetical protein
LTESEESSFSEEKEAKRLCLVRRAVVHQRGPKRAKVFCFFFSKKKNLAGIWQCGRARCLILQAGTAYPDEILIRETRALS